MRPFKIPESVLVVIHTADLEVLLIERADRPGFWQSVTGSKDRIDAEDIRLRVFYSRRSIEHSELARLTQIDYAREMAFIAVASGPDGEEETLGVARALMDPDNIEAEFGIVIRSDQKGGGLGQLLMKKLIAYLKQHGTQVLMAVVLDENLGMRALAERLGFNEQRSREEPGVRVVRLRLDG